ncbi:MAG: hypothetical protein QM493_01335 [Sulfurovum sp.]
MKTVELKIDDNNFEIFRTLIDNLKDGIIKSFEIKDTIEEVSDKEQIYYENLLSNMTKEDREVSSIDTIEI